jgi:hypothetical protein
VDADKSAQSDLLRGSVNQNKAGEHFEPVLMDRESALREIMEDHVSAAVIIPTNFMRNYLTGKAPVSLELIKNPAESVHPAVMEELLGALVTGMNISNPNSRIGWRCSRGRQITTKFLH